MPKFEDYVEVEAEIEVTVDDFLSECSQRDIQKLIDALREDGYLSPSEIVTAENPNIMDLEWGDVIAKLSRARLQLTVEEEETIKRIANRVV